MSFQVVNTQLPSYDDAVITIKPDDVGFNVDESPAYVEWMFAYDGPCVGSINLDGAEVDSQIYGASGVDQIFTYIIDTSIAGVYTVVFVVTPDDISNPAVSDIVMVTIAGSTTTTTTTDTTTPTTRPPPLPPVGYDPFYILIGGVIVVVVLGLVMLKRRRELYG